MTIKLAIFQMKLSHYNYKADLPCYIRFLITLSDPNKRHSKCETGDPKVMRGSIPPDTIPPGIVRKEGRQAGRKEGRKEDFI